MNQSVQGGGRGRQRVGVTLVLLSQAEAGEELGEGYGAAPRTTLQGRLQSGRWGEPGVEVTQTEARRRHVSGPGRNPFSEHWLWRLGSGRGRAPALEPVPPSTSS